ncbi:phage integrase SAM-like domain-containing protein [Kaistella sp. PBT33-4]|uniref:phage integrase SAM-like domain-containing protein n=1 Tax=Kaistella sp. PBT33-4 TaxID=3032000 RepID=UPI0023D85747|nr:phage integrase SAM-like domain-containing protein [Kaistella sp. PBT33-4]MDF0718929.1 phage integrase SAM-like domain-containing protein [Kaistella sp. PBT33-4]
MNVKFYLKNPKDGMENKIHMRVRVGRSIDLSIATKEVCLLEDWDADAGLLLERYTNSRGNGLRGIKLKNKIAENELVNSRLKKLKVKLEEAYREGSGKVNSSWLKGVVHPSNEENDFNDKEFLDYCDIFLESKGSTIGNDYVTKVKSIKEIISRYQINRKIKSLKLTDIDVSFKNDFEKYCLAEEGYAINYFERNFRFIKTILYHAKSFGYSIFAGLSNIKGKSEKTLFQVLSPDELNRISEASFSDDHLETAKDWLLISCFTAQRISDFMRFSTDMIVEKDKDGSKRLFIEFVQTKTNKQVLIPLDSRVVDILKRRNWSFPRKMSESKYNEHIKTVCDYVGINQVVEGSLSLAGGDKVENGRIVRSPKRSKRKPRKVKGMYPKHLLISSHIGRRTFATNNYGIIPTPYILVMTGHQTPQMLMKYIGKIEEQHSIELSNYIK